MTWNFLKWDVMTQYKPTIHLINYFELFWIIFNYIKNNSMNPCVKTGLKYKYNLPCYLLPPAVVLQRIKNRPRSVWDRKKVEHVASNPHLVKNVHITETTEYNESVNNEFKIMRKSNSLYEIMSGSKEWNKFDN